MTRHAPSPKQPPAVTRNNQIESNSDSRPVVHSGLYDG